MKVFIVFLGLFVINVSFLSYQGDLGRYVRCQTFLKAVAEECAAGAALYYDEEAYSGGQFRFSYEEGIQYTEYIIEEAKKEMPLPGDSVITYKVDFHDDYQEFEDESESGTEYEPSPGPNGGESMEEEDNPEVIVEITVITDDLFRLPFLEVTSIKRAAKYELPQ